MITVEEVRKLATLARIKLSLDEEISLAKDMENILGYVKQIQEVSGDINPVGGTRQKVRNILRDDTNPHETGIFTETLLAEVPQREGQYVKVKKIL